MVWLQQLARALWRGWRGMPVWRRRFVAGFLGLVGVLAVVSGAAGQVLVGCWLAANGLFFLRLGFWVVTHPRVVLRARRPVLAWALTAGILLTLLVHAGFEPMLAGFTEVLLPAGLIWLVALGCLFLLVGLGLAVGCVGVALGGLLGRREIEEERLARVGTAGVWLTLTACLLAAGVLSQLGAPDSLAIAVTFGWPIFSLWLAPLVRHLEAERLSAKLHSWMQRRLVVRRRGRRGLRVFDLRALSLALAGCLLAGLVAWAGFLNSLQSTVLLWMIREQSALEHLIAALGGQARDAAEAERLVLVTWDNPALHDARVQRTEPAVQAEIIRRLTAWDAACIVVPATTLDAEQLAAVGVRNPQIRFGFGRDRPRRPATNPPAAEPATQRAARDLPEMLAAARASGITLLVVPGPEGVFLDDDVKPPDLTDFGTNLAGLRVGTDRLPAFRVSSLPALATAWHSEEPPPLPWLVLGAVTGATNPAAAGAGRLPQIEPGAVLVDFTGVWLDEDFARVPVSAILQDQPVPVRHSEAQLWEMPAEFFRRKLVFLEAARPQRRTTPLGELSRIETLVYATRTLLAESALRPVATPWLGLWGCFWALGVGLTGAGRSLFGASARLAAAVVVIGLVSFAVFLLGFWLDPVFPIAAAGSAFLLVTQFSFALERRAKDQNRALLQRFVAPEVVEELLADPDGKLGLGGRRERVVVLFADVRGFTQFAEEHSPEEVVKVVNAYLHVMTDALNQHGGLLDKYTGDGLMALFRSGASEAEAVARALAAAMAIRDAVLALSANRVAGGARSLQVGIGLHVGEAVLGLVGNPVRQINYTALGHAVVVAARLQGFAGGGEVLVSEAIRAVAGDAFLLSAREPVQVKGLSAPVCCYTVSERRAD